MPIGGGGGGGGGAAGAAGAALTLLTHLLNLLYPQKHSSLDNSNVGLNTDNIFD